MVKRCLLVLMAGGYLKIGVLRQMADGSPGNYYAVTCRIHTTILNVPTERINEEKAKNKLTLYY
jgi:hypothetical protein